MIRKSVLLLGALSIACICPAQWKPQPWPVLKHCDEAHLQELALPMGMPKQIPVKWGRALLDQRALWLSAYPDEQQEATRATCMECNAWAKRLELRH